MEKEKDHAEVIKWLRANLGMSQGEFANLMGVTISAVCNWEKKLRTPRFSTFKKMVEIAKRNKIKLKMDDFIK